MGGTVDILKPTVHFDGGQAGRIVVADSLSFYEHDSWLNDVALGASFSGRTTAAMALRGGVKAWIAHEGGPGKDEAGIGGLPLSDQFGVPAAAVRTSQQSPSHSTSSTFALVTVFSRRPCLAMTYSVYDCALFNFDMDRKCSRWACCLGVIINPPIYQ